MAVILDDTITSSANWELPASQITRNATDDDFEYAGTGFAAAARCSVSATSADHKVTAYCRNAASVASEEVVLDIEVRRSAATGDPVGASVDCYQVRFIVTSGTHDTILVYQVVSGTQTFLTALSPSVGSLDGSGTTYTFAVEISGSNMTFYCNGTSTGTYSDSSVTTGNFTATRIQQQTTASALRMTEWLIETLEAGQDPTLVENFSPLRNSSIYRR
jgi:hypothetical protein